MLVEFVVIEADSSAPAIAYSINTIPRYGIQTYTDGRTHFSFLHRRFYSGEMPKVLDMRHELTSSDVL